MKRFLRIINCCLATSLAQVAVRADPPAPPPKAPAAKGPVSGADLLQHVNATVQWFRQAQAGSQWLSRPSDVFFWDTQRNLSKQVVEAGFASVRAEMPLVPPAPVKAAAPDPQRQRLEEMSAERSEHIGRVQGELAALDEQIQSTPKASRAPLEERRAALQSELTFLTNLKQALDQIGWLLWSASNDTTTTLVSKIDSLEQSVAGDLSRAAPPASAEPAAAKGMESGGLIARTGALLRLAKYLRQLDGLIASTDHLQAIVDEARAPVTAEIRTVVQGGEQVGDTLENADSGHIHETEANLQSLSQRFQVLWAALLPLRQEDLALGQSRRNLQDWRNSLRQREIGIARILGIKLGTILALLAIVVTISEVWGRMTIRYVTENHRRHQLLTLRRIVTALLMVLIVATGFVSDFGSLATFAGLLTAGIAVALQGIIASIAAYFFLISRYGIRLGDRITAGGVTGEVAEMGLVRIYLRELSQSGPDLHPTGRIVTFPNSIIFQTNPLFKQLPGTEYTWHEASVTLAAGANAAFVREKILAAVVAAYEQYRNLLAPPQPKAEKLSGVKIDLPKPYAHLRPSDHDLELAVGYPVDFQRVSEIDQLVLKSLTDAIAAEPDLAKSLSGHPRAGVSVRS